MNNVEENVINSLVKLWNSATADNRYTVNSAIKAGKIHGHLLELFSEAQIIDQISRFLADMVAICEHDSVPNRRDLFLCSCCFNLIISPQGIRVPLRLAQDIVRAFPISIWYRIITRVVTAYLNRTDLLEAFTLGLSKDVHPAIIENCLQGIRMYLRFASKDDDPENLSDLRSQVAYQIENLCRDARADILEYAEKAKIALQEYE